MKNEFLIHERYSFICLYNRKNEVIAKTKIDTFNVEILKPYKWYLRPDGYVATNNYNNKYMYLHKLLCPCKKNECVDHIDRNKLNNTIENLRTANKTENAMNKGMRNNNTSGKVGVHWSNENSKWCAMICVYKKHINLGYFDSYEDAVNCRVNAENKYFKEFRALDEKG